MLRDTLAALEQLPEASARLRKNLPSRAHPVLAQLEVTARQNLLSAEAYNMVPGRDSPKWLSTPTTSATIDPEAILGRCWARASNPLCGTLCRGWVRLPLASATLC